MLAIITSQRQKMEPHTKHTHTPAQKTHSLSHTHTHIHTYAHTNTQTHIYTQTHTQTPRHTYSHTLYSHSFVCVCVSLYVCMCVYIKRVTQTQISEGEVFRYQILVDPFDLQLDCRFKKAFSRCCSR